MVSELDALDRAILERIQASLPLVPRPFATLGEALGMDERQVLARVQRLKEQGVIRQIGAILDTRRLGYQSTLVAFHLPQENLGDTAARISAHPGVSHNYARTHHYNLWFTLAVPPGRDVEDEARRLADETAVADWLYLPALRVYKIRTHFRLGADLQDQPPGIEHAAASPVRELTGDDVATVRALQEDLPLVPRPFAAISALFALDEGELLQRARELEETGILRRFSAVLRHRRVGYRANGMACWVVPLARIDEIGHLAAGFPAVSHCYQRPAYPPRWPYTLFTMIHGQDKGDVESVVNRIAREAGLARESDHANVLVLYSTQEFKKERIRYFEEEK
jgi:siroheme decarboxylase